MTSDRVCPVCGTTNGADEVFCVSCHQFLSWPTTEARTGDQDQYPELAGPVEIVVSRAEPQPIPPQPIPPIPTEPDPVPPDLTTPDPAVVDAVVGALDESRRIADERGRTDLTAHLQQARRRLSDETFPVVVAGEFKRGKSTLVNALLQYDVCPVDADVVTAVPTMVTWAERPRVLSIVRTADGERSYEREIDLAELTAAVTEQADPADPERMRSVEVGLPHRLLQTGLTLVDTPGVGGLDSAHGFLTLNALRLARGTLFVTDAAQELTEPELGFLVTAAHRCAATALVVTKVDLYLHWRQIIELDRQHLARAGLDIPIIAVSSLLRLAALDDPSLDEESGFEPLFRFLAEQVVVRGRAEAATVAAQEVEFVGSQLQQELQIEQAVVANPETQVEVVQELTEVRVRASRLQAETATWQQTLADGIQDLISDVEHDLQARLRQVIRDAEEIVEQSDPRVTWADTEAWLRRRIAVLLMANRDQLSDRAEELAETVAEQFNLQAGTAVVLRIGGRDDQAAGVELQALSSLSMPGGRLAPFMAAGRSSYYLPMMLGSLVATAFPATIPIHMMILGVSALLGTGIGSKIIKDERTRQRVYRQQQAKSAVRKFVDEVAFLINKQTRDQLRGAQRQLRDDFQGRALQLQRSAVDALRRVEEVGRLDDGSRVERAQQLADDQVRLDTARSRTRELVGAPT